MMFLLDTDTIIYSLIGVPEVVENFRAHATSPKAVSVISYGELIYGAEKSQHRNKNLAKIHRLREIFPIIEISCAIMDTLGSLKADLSRQGKTVDDFDLLIGATALSLGYCLVSNNEKHFRKITDLELQNWTIKQ
ncbi:type II toxin-antitoxin system VapC family toxin [bacterium]|nr:type II toxin-antitoxin system VapC family toxin [bacterium]